MIVLCAMQHHLGVVDESVNQPFRRGVTHFIHGGRCFGYGGIGGGKTIATIEGPSVGGDAQQWQQ
jgi:hypothetical protein